MDDQTSNMLDEETSLVRGGQVIRSSAPSSSSSSSQKSITGNGWARLCIVLAVVGLTSSVVYINGPTIMSIVTTKLEEEVGDSGPRVSSPANVPGMPKTIDDGKDKALPAKPPAATSDFGGNGFGFENVDQALEVGAVAVLPVTAKTTTTTTSPPEKSIAPSTVVSTVSKEVPTSSSAMIQEETSVGEEEEEEEVMTSSNSLLSSSSSTIGSSSSTTTVEETMEEPLMTSSGVNGETVMESISPVFVKADNALTPAAVQTPTIIAEPTTTTIATTTTITPTASVIPTTESIIPITTTTTTEVDIAPSSGIMAKVKGFLKGMMESISPVFVKADNALTPAAVQTPTIIAEPTTIATTTTTITTPTSIIPTTASIIPATTTTATATATTTTTIPATTDIATSSGTMTKSAHSASETQSVKVGSDVKFSSTKSTTNPRPNIVFILADDLGYNSLSEDVSPWLWKMQEKGVKLENYYSQEACTPARAALLTGRIPLSIGLQYYEHSVDESGGLGLEETTLGEVFTAAGYETYMFGKWNLGNGSPRYLPTARGFSNFLGYLDGFNNYWSKNTPDIPEFRDFMFSNSQCYYMYDGEDVSTYSTTLYQNKAVDAIKTHDYTKPLFMYMAFQAVHDPFSEAGECVCE